MDAWARKYGLLAVTNAGMFETDYRTPTGYAKVGDRALNPRWKALWPGRAAACVGARRRLHRTQQLARFSHL